jgi:hypothetical protein
MPRGVGMVSLVLIAGAVIGGLIGELLISVQALSSINPYLIKTITIVDIPAVTINLYIIKFIVGLSLTPNLISILGAISAVMLFRRM